MVRMSAGGSNEAAPGNGDECGCRYCFTVFHCKADPTLALVERPVRPHTGHTSQKCRWISEEGREAVRKAFDQGIRDCGALRAALRASIAARIGRNKDDVLTEADRDLIRKTRPDLVRDLQVTAQDMMYVGVDHCRLLSLDPGTHTSLSYPCSNITKARAVWRNEHAGRVPGLACESPNC